MNAKGRVAADCLVHLQSFVILQRMNADIKEAVAHQFLLLDLLFRGRTKVQVYGSWQGKGLNKKEPMKEKPLEHRLQEDLVQQLTL